MRGRLFLALATAGALLSGCSTYRLEAPDQLYIGQSYLPLPLDMKAPAAGSDAAYPCDSVPALARDADDRQNGLQPMPGMVLHVTQTTYRRNGADSIPVLSDWSWRLPPRAGCVGSAAWSRRDLLMVRNLLSGARIGDNLKDPGYFQKLVSFEGCKGGCDLAKLQPNLLDPFVRNLRITYRHAEQPGDTSPVGPDVPSAATAPWRPGLDLSAWFRGQDGVIGADLFADPSGVGAMSLAEFCGGLAGPRQRAAPATAEAQQDLARRAVDDRLLGALGPNPDTVTWEEYRDGLKSTVNPPAGPPGNAGGSIDSLTAPACNFSLRSLVIDTQAAWSGSPMPQNRLILLETGDSLLLFRPLAHNALLDSSRRWICPPDGATTDNGSRSASCAEADRISQGFVDFDVAFEVGIEGRRERIAVDPAMTVTDFERRYGQGLLVARLERPLRWLGGQLQVVDLQYDDVVRPIAPQTYAHAGRLPITFMEDGSGAHGVNGVIAYEAMKARILLAPGDVLVLRPPGRD